MMAPTSSRGADHDTRGSAAALDTSTGGAEGVSTVGGGRRRGGGVPPVKLTEEQTLRFIELYREHECLWNTRSPEYRINRSRELAIESLRRRMGRVGGGGVLQSMGKGGGAGQLMSADAVKKKINCLRTAFKQEHDKVLAKKCRSGNSGETYVPRLTWYNAFLFIRDYMVQRTSTASMASKSESPTSAGRSPAKSTDVLHETSTSSGGKGGGGGNNVTIRWKNHADILVKGLTEFFRKQYLVDTDVSIRGETLKTHKMILALFLPTFKKSVDDVKGQLHGLNLDYVANGTEDVRALIEFVYTGTVSVAKDRLGHLGRLAECLKFEGLSRAIRQLCDTSTASTAAVVATDVRPESTNRSLLDTVLADGGDMDADLIDQDIGTGALDLPVETILGANNGQEDERHQEDEDEEEEEEEDEGEEEAEEEEEEVENDEEYYSSEVQDDDDYNDDDDANDYDDDEGTGTLQDYPVETVLVENDYQDTERQNTLQSAMENEVIEDNDAEHNTGRESPPESTSSLRIADIQGTYRRSSRVLRSYRRRQRTDKSDGGGGGGGTASKVTKLIVCKDMFGGDNNASSSSMTRADYFRQWRNAQTAESRDARLASQARLMRERRASETDEARQQRLQREAARVRERRSAETPESRQIRREKHARLMRERRTPGQQSESSSQEPFPMQVSYYDDDDAGSSIDGTDVTDPEADVGQNSGFYISGT